MDNMARHVMQPTDDREDCGSSQDIAPDFREAMRSAALRNALRKREAGVPTYSVPEAAALLSISQEYLYRLIQADGFPAIRMRIGAKQGRYVVPALAVEQLFKRVADTGICVESTDWTAQWQAATSGGAA